MSDQVKDKHGDPIHVDDTVFTPFRGGTREGEVEEIIRTAKEAEEEGVKDPPKVIFHNQRGKQVNHNPEALEVIENGD